MSTQTDAVKSKTMYRDLVNSKKGRELIALAEARAADFLFDPEYEYLNKDVYKKLSSKDIYNAVTIASSLTFVDSDNDKTYTVKPYFDVNEMDALAILQDVQITIQDALITTLLDNIYNNENKVLHVYLPDILEDYDVPDDVDEWIWIKINSSY